MQVAEKCLVVDTPGLKDDPPEQTQAILAFLIRESNLNLVLLTQDKLQTDAAPLIKSIARAHLKAYGHNGTGKQASSLWHKTLFVVSKVDLLRENQMPGVWFEIGRLLGAQNLLEPPNFKHIHTVGLPCEQKEGKGQCVGKLSALLKRIKHDVLHTSNDDIIARAISEMAVKLEKHITETSKFHQYKQLVYPFAGDRKELRILAAKYRERIRTGGKGVERQAGTETN